MQNLDDNDIQEERGDVYIDISSSCRVLGTCITQSTKVLYLSTRKTHRKLHSHIISSKQCEKENSNRHKNVHFIHRSNNRAARSLWLLVRNYMCTYQWLSLSTSSRLKNSSVSYNQVESNFVMRKCCNHFCTSFEFCQNYYKF